MNVKAPFDGKLSGFDIEIGQSISRGGRLGQIDSPNDFKLTAFIDEFYVTRIDLGQEASFEKDGTIYQLTVAKIYPNVKNGQFEIDLAFVGDAPKARRGQSIQAKLTLGDTSKALLIPNGSFFQDTGGNWIFVVTNNGNEATKRSVRLGRRNSQFIEVIEGLEKGERVVTSSYANYQSLDRLKLSADK
jgi:HlyD family secretion protein